MPNIKVLVVEDDAIIASHIAQVVTGFGYEVPALLSSGEETLDAVEQYQPDVILMDVRLRGKMNGVEAGQEIFQRHGTPIIFLSAFSLASSFHKDPTPPFEYLSKPVTQEKLRDAIKKVLQVKAKNSGEASC